jgi:hypothetical protein
MRTAAMAAMAGTVAHGIRAEVEAEAACERAGGGRR